MLKQEKGITLIALIITIIVLLILSLVTIQSLSGSDSAPAKASQAKAQEDVADIKDGMTTEAGSALTDWYAFKYAGAETPSISDTNIQDYVKGRVEKIKAPAGSSASVETITKETTEGEHKDSYKITIKNGDSKVAVYGYINADGLLTWETPTA